jgi:hypothetical protein
MNPQQIKDVNECPACDAFGICPSHKEIHERQKAETMFPNHHPDTALANYRAGREVWDTNGDLR